MSLIIADRIRDTSTTTGTGSLTVSGTAPTGFKAFSAVMANADTSVICIQHQTADEWEVCETVSDGSTGLTRGTLLASSTGSRVSFSSGTKDVWIDFAAAKVVDIERAQTLTNKTLSLDSNTVQFTAPGTGAVARAAKDALGEVIDVMNFGAVGDASTDDTSAINAAIAYGNTLSRKALYFPPNKRYKITAALTSLAGSQWTVFGECRDATWIGTTADAVIFTLDATAADTNFTTIKGLYLLGANTGSDTGSMGIKADGSTSSLTGVNFLRVQDCFFQNLKYGIYLDPTQLDSVGLSAHSRWEIIGNTFLPGSMDCSIYSPSSSPADGSLIGNNWIRGTVAGIQFGDGTDAAIGDLSIFGNQISAPIGINLVGPTTSGHYNQNVNITGNQLDGAISSATLKARNMKNFRFVWNNSTSSFGPDIDSTCSDYWVEDRNALKSTDTSGNAKIFGKVPGEIFWFAASSAPAGSLECNGSAVSRTTYAKLFSAISTTFGSGNGSTTFNLPDLRGQFIRGYDHGAGVDSGRSFGSNQTDAFQSHQHLAGNSVRAVGSGSNTVGTGGGNMLLGENDGTTAGSGGTPRLASETRPVNVALLPCIAY